MNNVLPPILKSIKSKKDQNTMISALDIGTSKVVVIVAELQSDGILKIIGKGQHVSKGLKKGVVVNIENTMQAIQRAVEEAELMADTKITEVYTGIAGSHIQSINSHGMVKIKDEEVTQMDVDRVRETAEAITLATDQEVLHTLPQEYIIDDQQDIKEPLEMSGMKLNVKVHIISGSIAARQNIIKCIRRCGLEVIDLVFQPLASSHAVLTQDEKELGVCLIDIGGGTTDIAVIKNGAFQHTSVIPVAGDQITNDIAIAFRTTTQIASDIKETYGSAMPSLSSTNEEIEISLVDGEKPKIITPKALAQVIEPRIEELFEQVQNEINRSPMGNRIDSGIVITGGSSMLKGMVEIGEKIFNMPVRIGIPRDIDGLLQVVENPRYATGVGLLIMGKNDIEKNENSSGKVPAAIEILKRAQNWFKGNF
jgi:cell division protein FtsA